MAGGSVCGGGGDCGEMIDSSTANSFLWDGISHGVGQRPGCGGRARASAHARASGGGGGHVRGGGHYCGCGGGLGGGAVIPRVG